MESLESPRQQAISFQPKKHEDRIAGKGFTSMTHYNLVQKFIPRPPVLKIPDPKSCSGQGTEKARENPRMEFGMEKIRGKKKTYS